LSFLDWDGFLFAPVATKRIPEHFPSVRGLLPEYQEFAVVEQFIAGIKCLPEPYFCDKPGAIPKYINSNEFTIS